MSEFVHTIQDFFSDFWLEIDLFFGKLFKRKAKEKAVHEEAGRVIKKEERKAVKLSFSLRILRMSIKERLAFFDQIATLVGSGVTLIDSLAIIKAQTKKKGLQKLFNEMIHDISTGMSLAESMYRFPHIFPRMQAALIEAGEKSGNLKTVLAAIMEEMENQQDFLRKVTGAMFYPIMLMVLAIAMVVGMMAFVIPKIAGMYASAHVELPIITQVVINISDYIVAQWKFLLLYIVGGLVVLWLLFSKLTFGHLLWEKIISAIPVFGRINKEKNLMLIASNLSMLLQSGVLISDAFEITEKTVDNLHFRRALREVRHGIIMGREVSEMMGLENLQEGKFKEHKFFPLQFAQLMHIGETTGTIAAMLEKIKINYHKSIDYTLKNISTLIEPLMIFVVAVLVGSILLAVMLPFFYIGTTIS